jgi:hypothetical protein
MFRRGRLAGNASTAGEIIKGGQREMEFEGYCVKCREKRTVAEGEVTKTAKGVPMVKGKCPKCGTVVTRFLAKKDVKE